MLARRVAHAVRPFGARAMSKPSWATVDPETLSAANPCQLENCLGGVWSTSKESISIPDPMNGEPFIKMPNTSAGELGPFVDSLAACPKTGLHNPLKNPERYVMLGEVSNKAAKEMGVFKHARGWMRGLAIPTRRCGW